MTKMDGRTKDAYNLQLEQSLGRLQTDMIDLVQFHEVIRLEDPDRILRPAERSKRRSPHGRRARFVTSGLPDIKIQQYISGCLPWPSSTAFISTRCKCR